MTQEQPPLGGGKVALLTGGLVVLVVAVVAAGGLLAQKVEPADPPAAAAPVESVTASPTAPIVVPSRNPRRQPDLDRGRPIANGVFVEVADGWQPETPGYSVMRATSFDRGASVTFSVSERPMPSRPLLRPDAEAFAEVYQLSGVRIGAVRSVPPPNLNTFDAAAVSFTARRTWDGVTYSLVGECVRLRGRPAINDVSASICWAANVQDEDTVRPEVQQMIGSLTGSI